MLKRFATLTASVVVGMTTLAALPAAAAPSDYHFLGYAGGTQVRLLGGVVRSDLTSASGLDGSQVPAAQENSLASARVGSLLSVGVIATAAKATAAGDGTTTEYQATTAKVSLLDGLIKADAVDTVNRSTVNSAGRTGGVDTTFVRLTVSGTVLPIEIRRNFTVSIPGVASVVLNESRSTPQGNGLVTEGSAIRVTLLAPFDGAPTGSTIVVNPMRSEIAPIGTSSPIGGYAYVTQVKANVGSEIEAHSGPTASIAVPTGGSGGSTLYNSTAAVDLPGLLYVGAVESSATGTSNASLLDSATTAQAARVNVLNGLITADAVKASSRNRKVGDGQESVERSTSLVDLKLLGLRLPVKPKPNTAITIPGIVKIVLNEQETIGGRLVVTGLHVTLLSPAGGLGAGADIRVAVASSWLGQ